MSALRVVGFPGQGAQSKGMGGDLFERFPELTAAADEVLGYSTARMCLDDPDGTLRLTQFAQPALYVVEALAWTAYQLDDPAPTDFVVGHSVGEYAALYAAGVFDFATGVELVRRRGEVMSAGPEGTMAAVLGLDLPEITALLAGAGLDGLDIALHNAPGQYALSGPIEDIEKLVAATAEAGVKCVRLNVSGPFHSRYLRPAAREFAPAVAGLRGLAAGPAVIANVTARPYEADRIGELLVEQICRPVLWRESVEYLASQGDFQFVELGPGKTLTGMVRRITDLMHNGRKP